ncbi:MAG TPA: MarR family transcriptional regulator [Acidimicrobiales bacterium]|nr:MarR family transcriptional regulator [Acidimicrobiales bacterium]
MSRPLDFDPIIEASRQWSAHGWVDASGGMAAITSIVRAQQLFLARIDAVLRPLELTFARYEVLMLLLFSRRGALPLNKIGARLQVHPTSVTNAVDRLEEQDLIKRVPHSSDRRTTLAEILPVGRELALRATAALNDEVFSQPGMGDEDLELLVAVLQRFRQEAGDFAVPVSPARAPLRPQSTSEDTFGGATARGAGAGGANRATSS